MLQQKWNNVQHGRVCKFNNFKIEFTWLFVKKVVNVLRTGMNEKWKLKFNPRQNEENLFIIKCCVSNLIQSIQIHFTYIDERCLRPLKIPWGNSSSSFSDRYLKNNRFIHVQWSTALKTNWVSRKITEVKKLLCS